MPGKEWDVESHMKGLSTSEAEKWVKAADIALAECENEQGNDCEGNAVKVANAMVTKLRGQESVSLRERIRETLDEEEFGESATIKSRIQGLLKTCNSVASHKNVPKAIKAKVTELRTLLHSRYADLAGDGTGEGVEASEAAGGCAEGFAETFNEVRGGCLVAVEED